MLAELHKQVRLQMQSNVNRSSAKLDHKSPIIHVSSYKHFLNVSAMKKVLTNVAVSKSSSIVFILLPHSDLNILNRLLPRLRTHLRGGSYWAPTYASGDTVYENKNIKQLVAGHHAILYRSSCFLCLVALGRSREK